MQYLPDALAAMAPYRQFILYKVVPIPEKPGKTNKLPVDPQSLSVYPKGTDWQKRPEMWSDFETCAALANTLGDTYGVGFLLTDNDPFFVVDVDSCRDASGGWSYFSQTLCGALPGAAIEVSHSGVGLHLFGTYTSMPDHGCRDCQKNGAEMYHTGRFIALTGLDAVGNAATDLTSYLPSFIQGFFPPIETKHKLGWTDGPIAHYTSDASDEELLSEMLASKPKTLALDPSQITFEDLWTRNVGKLALKWPHDKDDYNYSQADMALASHLAFWTGSNCERMLKFMWQSSLVRPKWETREQYVVDTVQKAADLQEDHHSVKPPINTEKLDEYGATRLRGSSPAQVELAEKLRAQAFETASPEAASVLANQSSAKFWLDNKDRTPEQLAQMVTPIDSVAGPAMCDEPELISGYQYLSSDMQLDFFKGCVYVADVNKVFTPSGQLLAKEQFNTLYGGYVFQMEETGNGDSKKAWDAFTLSRAVRWPKAHMTCFRPDLPPQQILELEGLRQLNTYVPITTRRMPGDAGPFLRHLELLFPNPKDREVMLSYMAACVQFIGQKFQWAPLIQGVEGNGKTLFTRCVQYAIGERYTHMPRADEVDEKFNEWMFCNLFIGMEDVYYPESKRHIIEILKPMITNDRQPLRAMQASQVMGSTCANFIFNSNHKDAIKKTRRDRRYAVFFTPQQTEEDLARDGINEAYFVELYSWLRNDGYAIVNEMLQTYAIKPEFNPALESGGLAARAPLTSSTEEAIAEGRGAAEQCVLEAIEEGRPGFAGGWVSSIALNELLKSLRKDLAISQNRRGEFMSELGYVHHPALPGGRTHSPTTVDGGSKPRLYIKRGHISSGLQKNSEIVTAYEKAQTGAQANEVAAKFA